MCRNLKNFTRLLIPNWNGSGIWTYLLCIYCHAVNKIIRIFNKDGLFILLRKL